MFKNLLVFLFSALVSVLLAEGALRLVVDPVDFLAITTEKDPILNHRIPAGASGHDAWGYRNAEIPQKADILAIGDSMTYGIMAKSFQAWPAQLQEITGKRVYSAALGGYGPLHYLHLLRTRAPELSPEQVIVMIYPGNDLLDAYNLTYSNDNWSDYRLSGADALDADLFLAPKETPSLTRWIREALAHHSVLYRMITQSAFFDGFRNRSIQERFTTSFPYEHLGQTVVLDPEKRLEFANFSEERVQEALQISTRALDEISLYCKENGIKLHVALMPVREHVFHAVTEGLSDDQQTAMQALSDNMLAIEDTLIAYLDSAGISWTNLRPALAEELTRTHVYPPADGHPNALGYRLVAEKLAPVTE